MLEPQTIVPCALHDIAWKHLAHVWRYGDVLRIVLPPLDTTLRWRFTSWFLPLSQLAVATVAVEDHRGLSIPHCTLATATVAVNWPGLQPILSSIGIPHGVLSRYHGVQPDSSSFYNFQFPFQVTFSMVGTMVELSSHCVCFHKRSGRRGNPRFLSLRAAIAIPQS